MKPKHRKPRDLNYTEKKLMLALGLKDVRQLDKLIAQPISQDAADNSQPPDEEYDLADRMYEEADRQWASQREFSVLFESGYLN